MVEGTFEVQVSLVRRKSVCSGLGWLTVLYCDCVIGWGGGGELRQMGDGWRQGRTKRVNRHGTVERGDELDLGIRRL